MIQFTQLKEAPEQTWQARAPVTSWLTSWQTADTTDTLLRNIRYNSQSSKHTLVDVMSLNISFVLENNK